MKTIRVRMYRQGLGDSFLLTFKTSAEPVHVLIDCGVLLQTKDEVAKTRTIAENVLKETDGRIDALIVTHEHWDHVSGFSAKQARDLFEQLEIGQVWVAWTEDPDDALADELAGEFDPAFRAVAGAESRLAAKGVPDRDREMGMRLRGMLDFLGADKKSKDSDDAMDWVTKRDPPPRFLRPGDVLPAFGVRVLVLGPPREEKSLRKDDPSEKHPETYHLAAGAGVDRGFLAAVEAQDGGPPDRRQPFRAQYRLTEAEARREEAIAGYWKADDWRRVDNDWLGQAGALALQYDGHINNTSLVLAFELEEDGPVLLFPGDAQVGNWLSWERAPLPPGAPSSADLLARTVLYKVGHHGSHNATLREKGLELMTSPHLVALIPVDEKVALAKKPHPWHMPFEPLKDALMDKTKGRVLASDRGLMRKTKPAKLSAAEWKRFQKQTDVKPGWIDYTVKW